MNTRQTPLYILSYEDRRGQDMLQKFHRLGWMNRCLWNGEPRYPLHVCTGVSIHSLSDPRPIPQAMHKTWSVMLGHLDMIRQFYEDTSSEWGIFCEDDILLHPRLVNDLENVVDDCTAMNLDILCIGYLCENPIETYSNFPEIKVPSGNNALAAPYHYREYPDNLWGCQMYMLSRSYARQVLDRYIMDNMEYAYRTLNKDMDLKPFSADWTITKDSPRRALLYPLLVIEDGKNRSSHQAQDDAHTRCFYKTYSDSFV